MKMTHHKPYNVRNLTLFIIHTKTKAIVFAAIVRTDISGVKSESRQQYRHGSKMKIFITQDMDENTWETDMKFTHRKYG